MNDIIRTKSGRFPNASVPQLPLPIGCNTPMTSFPPEFWLEISTDRQQAMIDELKKNHLEYIVYEIEDSSPLKSMIVCRCLRPYFETERIIRDICNKLQIDEFIVSDGSLSSVSAKGDLQVFISFD